MISTAHIENLLKTDGIRTISKTLKTVGSVHFYTGRMNKEQRLDAIESFIRENGQATVNDICRFFERREEDVRDWMRELMIQGRLTKTEQVMRTKDNRCGEKNARFMVYRIRQKLTQQGEVK